MIISVKVRMVAMDAGQYRGMHDGGTSQYSKRAIVRELDKAYVGFYSAE